MKLILFVSLFGVAFCARLDNTYLPPAGAGSAGGYQGPGFGGAPGGGGGRFPGGGGGGGGGRFPGGGGGGGGGGRFPGGGGGGGGGANIPIVRYDNNPNTGDGTYDYAYESGNGIKAQEQGRVTDGTQAQGSFSYTGTDGQQYSIQYTADENGFRPVGAHLPTPPPIPDAILKSIEQNLAEEARGGGDDGQYRGGSGGGGGGGGSGGSGGGGGGGFRPAPSYGAPRPSGSFSPGSGYNY